MKKSKQHFKQLAFLVESLKQYKKELTDAILDKDFDKANELGEVVTRLYDEVNLKRKVLVYSLEDESK